MLKQRFGLNKYFHNITRQDCWAMLFWLWSVAILLIVFPMSIPRFGEALWDLLLELGRFGADFINTLVGTQLVVRDSNLLLRSQYVKPIVLPQFDWERFNDFWFAFVDSSTFSAYLQDSAINLRKSLYFVLLLVPFAIMVYTLFKHSITKHTSTIKRSRMLRGWLRFEQSVIVPSKNCITDFVAFLRANRAYVYLFLLVFGLIFNVGTVIAQIFAWYFYLLTTLRIHQLYMAFYKLFVDVFPAVQWVPGWIWFIVGILVFSALRKKRAYSVLEHNEAKNKGFLSSLPLVCFVWGTMGSRKTTLMTDMALSYEALYRYKAYEFMLECDLMFPEFPWLAFERFLRESMALDRGDECRIYNLCSAKRAVDDMETAYYTGRFDLWGYNKNMDSPDGLVLNDLFETLRNYAQLYLIYVVSSTLILSNYGIRDDGVMQDLGNFPQWSFDFFHRDPRLSQACSRHSHIVDFDLFRLGRKMIENNVDSDGFEFGIVVLTEIEKERGNQLENKRYKVDDVYANPLNDRFNDSLKLCRHRATVCHFPFVVFLTDGQRPESWGADARELSQLIRVEDCSDKRCSMPLRFVDDYIHDSLLARFEGIYRTYRFYRADDTFLMYAFKRVCCWVHKRYMVAHNTFDYYNADLSLERGTMDGKEDIRPYYLSTKKIYSDRFATDAYSGFFDVRTSRSTQGIDDIETYECTTASIDEMLQCNSYLIRDLSRRMRLDIYGGGQHVQRQ